MPHCSQMLDGRPVSRSQNRMVRDELYAGCDVIGAREAIANHAVPGTQRWSFRPLVYTTQRSIVHCKWSVAFPALSTCRGDHKSVSLRQHDNEARRSNVGEKMTASSPLAVFNQASFVLKRPERPTPDLGEIYAILLVTSCGESVPGDARRLRRR